MYPMYNRAPKLSDCVEHGPQSELFIVEGDSAGRSVQRVRNQKFQAVLAMQGKPLNAYRAGAKEIRSNRQFRALLKALRVPLVDASAGQAQTDLGALPYQKIILLFDPDADGIHARILMLLFFHRWLAPLLSAGRIFDSHAPQWKLSSPRLAEPIFAGTPEHMRAIRSDLEAQGVQDLELQRYQGLGNLDLEVLENRCVHPKTRVLQALGHAEAQQALIIFSAQMEQQQLDRNSHR